MAGFVDYLRWVWGWKSSVEAAPEVNDSLCGTVSIGPELLGEVSIRSELQGDVSVEAELRGKVEVGC